jgi:8-oxo-dGTP pyrophosphatase MutT (NUDIX family)
MFKYQKYWSSLILENKKFASAHVVIFKNNKFLILKRSKTDDWMPEHYGLPGGKLDKNENIKEALVRECKEEANIDIKQEDLIFLPKISSKSEHGFYYTTKFSGDIKLDHEHDDYKWTDYEHLDDLKIVPDLKDIVNEALEKLK